jgi:hypothetical protein
MTAVQSRARSRRSAEREPHTGRSCRATTQRGRVSDRVHPDARLIGEQRAQVIRVASQDRGTRYRQCLGGDESVGGVTATGSPEQLISVPAGGGRRRCGADGLEYLVHGCVTWAAAAGLSQHRDGYAHLGIS